MNIHIEYSYRVKFAKLYIEYYFDTEKAFINL